MRSMMAEHEALAIVTVHFFGFAGSIATPLIVWAVPSEYSLKPVTSLNVDLRTVFLLLPTALRPVSQSSAMTGLPSDQTALAFISKVYFRLSAETVALASRGFGSPVL